MEHLSLPSHMRLRVCVSLFLALAGLFFLATRAHAATYSWVGSDGRWETTSNWANVADGTRTTVPTSSDSVLLRNSGATLQLRTTVTLANLYVSPQWSGSLLLGSGSLRVTSAVRVGSGRIITGTGSFKVEGDFTMTGGMLRSAGTVTLSGALSITKGATSSMSVFVSTGTILLGGTAADQTLTSGANTSVSLKNMTIRNRAGGTSDDIIVNLNGGLNLSGTLLITLGDLDLDTNNMSFASASGFTLASTAQATMVADQNMYIPKNITIGALSTLTVSGGTLTLNGGSNQLVDLAGQHVNNLTLNKSGAQSIYLTGNLNLSGTLLVTLGILDLATNNSVLSSSSGFTLVSAANARFITDQNVFVPKNITVGSSSVLTVSGGTLTLNGGSNQLVNLAGQHVNNLTLNKSGAQSIYLTGNLNLSGTLLVTLGTLDLSTNSATFATESGITLANAANATMTTNQNMYVGRNIKVGAAATLTVSAGILTLNGSGQTLDLDSQSLYGIVIHSSGSTTLKNNATVSTSLQVSTGSILVLNTYTLTATTAAIINYATITEGTGVLSHAASETNIANSSYVASVSIAYPSSIYLTITDADENINGTAADTISVTLTSGNGDSETVTLTETDKTSGVFRNAVATNATRTVVLGDGTLQSPASTSLAFAYTDAQDLLAYSDIAELTIADTTTVGGTTPTTGSTRGGGGGGGGGPRPATVTTSSASSAPATLNTTGKTPREIAREKAKSRRDAILKRAAERKAARINAAAAKAAKAR